MNDVDKLAEEELMYIEKIFKLTSDQLTPELKELLKEVFKRGYNAKEKEIIYSPWIPCAPYTDPIITYSSDSNDDKNKIPI